MVSSQLRALDTVLLRAQETEERRLLQEKLDQMALELERARMTAEDARTQSLYNSGMSGGGPVTWREYAGWRNQLIVHLTNDVIAPALDLVEEAVALLNDGRADLATDVIQEARRVLADDESDSAGEESSEA